MEIERKFLVKMIPANLEHYKKRIIEQGYVSTSPVVRIRQSNEKFILTIKGKGFVEREEFELFISKEEYAHFKTKLDYPIIKKTRYLIPYQDYTIELDIFEGHLTGLILAEVEFNSSNDANNFIAPTWFGKDVSMTHTYHNSHLCQLTSIDSLQIDY